MKRGTLATFTVVIARLDRAIQYSEAFMTNNEGFGLLDTPLSRSMTVPAMETTCA
jgi:hypothetical protein